MTFLLGQILSSCVLLHNPCTQIQCTVCEQDVFMLIILENECLKHKQEISEKGGGGGLEICQRPTFFKSM